MSPPAGFFWVSGGGFLSEQNQEELRAQQVRLRARPHLCHDFLRFHDQRHLIMFGCPSPLYTENISFCFSELSIWTARSPSHCLPHNLLHLPLALRTPLPLARLTLEQEGRQDSRLMQLAVVTAPMASWTASPLPRMMLGCSRGDCG